MAKQMTVAAADVAAFKAWQEAEAKRSEIAEQADKLAAFGRVGVTSASGLIKVHPNGGQACYMTLRELESFVKHGQLILDTAGLLDGISVDRAEAKARKAGQ
jgi:hypothetical protein